MPSNEPGSISHKKKTRFEGERGFSWGFLYIIFIFSVFSIVFFLSSVSINNKSNEKSIEIRKKYYIRKEKS